jgi:hypothetical protein
MALTERLWRSHHHHAGHAILGAATRGDAVARGQPVHPQVGHTVAEASKKITALWDIGKVISPKKQGRLLGMRAIGRDRAVEEWLKWLCESGSLPGRH